MPNNISTSTQSEWQGRVSQQWIDLVGADWDGELLSQDVVDELIENVEKDPSVTHILARLEEHREELYSQRHHEYAVPYQYERVSNTEDNDLPQSIEVEHCDSCGEFECDYNWCVDHAFLGNTSESAFLCNAEQLIEGREYDQVASDGPDIVNDTFLVLAQDIVTLDDFNAHVREIYKAANPEKGFEGWSFTLTVEENADEGYIEGVFAAKAEYADAVAVALNTIAKGLDNGEYSVTRY